MLRVTAITLTGFLSSVSIAQASGSDALYQMDLEQLMDLPVTSVNKRPSSLAESAGGGVCHYQRRYSSFWCGITS